MESPGVGGVEEQECLSKNIPQIFEKRKSVMHTRRDVSLILMRSTDTKALGPSSPSVTRYAVSAPTTPAHEQHFGVEDTPHTNNH